MQDYNGEASLTTSQVAAMCSDDMNESTVRYLARAGTLRGHKVGNRWRFERTDAERFCTEWRSRQEAKRDRPSAGWSVRRTLDRVLQGQTIALLNLAASVVSLVELAFGGLSLLVGLGLAFLNYVGAGLAWAKSRDRHPKQEDIVNGEPVDPTAVQWGLQAGAWSIPQVFSIATLLATTAYVGVVATPLADLGGDGLSTTTLDGGDDLTTTTVFSDDTPQASTLLPPTQDEQDPADSGIAPDMEVVVIEDSVNMRSEASTSGEIVTVLSVGDPLIVLFGPEEIEDDVWWEVVTVDTGEHGWVVEDFIEPAE